MLYLWALSFSVVYSCVHCVLGLRTISALPLVNTITPLSGVRFFSNSSSVLQRRSHSLCAQLGGIFLCAQRSINFSHWFVWDCIPPPSPIIYLASWELLYSGMFAVILPHFYLPVFFFIPLFQWFSLIILLLLLLLLFHLSLFCLVSIECLSVSLVPMQVLSYFNLFTCISSLGQGLVARLRILLAMGMVLSCRGWVAGCFGHLSSTCDECC